jgi:hypothetical protein
MEELFAEPISGKEKTMLTCDIKEVKDGRIIGKDASVDIVNAANRIITMMKNGSGFDDAMSKVSQSFDLTAKEMDEVQKAVEKSKAKDSALSELFGGALDPLLEVTEKEAKDCSGTKDGGPGSGQKGHSTAGFLAFRRKFEAKQRERREKAAKAKLTKSSKDSSLSSEEAQKIAPFSGLVIDDKVKQLIALFSSDKKIEDHRDIHSIAKALGIEPSELEDVSYALLQSFFSNGKFATQGDITKIDQKELAMGDKVEREHTDNPIIARRIALDHLAEIPDYYTRLQKMESGAEKPTKDGGRYYHVEKYANEKYYVEDPEGGDETGPFPSGIMAQVECDKRNDKHEKATIDGGEGSGKKGHLTPSKGLNYRKSKTPEQLQEALRKRLARFDKNREKKKNQG